MQLDRPKTEAVCLIARNTLTGKSKSVTVYGATPEEVIERATAALLPKSRRSISDPHPRKARPVPAA